MTSNNTENQDSVTQNDNVYQNNTDLDEITITKVKDSHAE